MAVTSSILTSTKKILGLEEDYTAFDLDVITHINTVFSRLKQLGIGPAEGFLIEDETATWDDFVSGRNEYNAVKSYMYLRVRLLFDPPQTSYLISSQQSQIEALEVQMNYDREDAEWTDPFPVESTPPW